MWMIALKGFSGSGKSTLGRALSRQLGWPIIDKDDIKDLIDGRAPDAGGLAYAVMLNVARRQLLQGLNVICDSPLTFSMTYEHARHIAIETHASLAIIECHCSDEHEWSQRINARKALQLAAHHQTDWDSFQVYRHKLLSEANYPINDPLLVVDTERPLHEIIDEVIVWLDRHSGQSSLEDTTARGKEMTI